MTAKTHKTIKLHWRLFFPLVILIWTLIGITMAYFVVHERDRLKVNLENRLLNVNSSVIDAYEAGANLQSTVDFIRLFTDKTTLDQLHITVYNDRGVMIADNPEATISIYRPDGSFNPDMKPLWDDDGSSLVMDMDYLGKPTMVSALTSPDEKIHSFAALPYEAEVVSFLSVDNAVWIVVIILGIIMSIIAYIGLRAVCRNVYMLKDFADMVANDNVPEDVHSWKFSNDELGDVSRNLVTVYLDKVKAQEEKINHESRIGMSVSHELNTPVGIIKGYLDSIAANPDMAEDVRERFLLRARENTDRLALLIQDVSTVMRLQNDEMKIEIEDVRMLDIVSQVAEDAAYGILASTMTFSYDIPEDCTVRANKSLLVNALLNLVNNAAIHSEGDRITLRWEGVEDVDASTNDTPVIKHLFCFSDNGRGVSAEHLPRLFDLFYRADYGRSRRNGGSGLGLSLVKRVITAFGGDITVRNSTTGGLEFHFSIPEA